MLFCFIPLAFVAGLEAAAWHVVVWIHGQQWEGSRPVFNYQNDPEMGCFAQFLHAFHGRMMVSFRQQGPNPFVHADAFLSSHMGLSQAPVLAALPPRFASCLIFLFGSLPPQVLRVFEKMSQLFPLVFRQLLSAPFLSTLLLRRCCVCSKR